MKATKEILGILITVAILTQVHAQSFLTNGLVAYYPLKGNANDATGNGNNGTATGVVYTNNRFGIPNSAASFAGNASSKITLNTTNVNVAPYFTVSLWVNCAANSGNGNPRIVSTTAYEIGTIGTASDRSPYIAQWGFSSTVPTNTISAGSWSQLVGVCDGTNLLLYLNGVLVNSQALGQPLTYIPGVFSTLGVRCELGTDDYGGLMSDIRIYNVPFTSDQVAQLYTYESPPLVGLAKAVKPTFSNLSLGTIYQLQVSADLNTWTNQGPAFTATNSTMIYPQYFDVADWGQLFFRLQVAP